MPELPEIETIKTGTQHLCGQTIHKINVWQEKLRYPILPDLNDNICKRTIKKISRRAKYLIFELNDRSGLIIHLGMSGSLTMAQHNSPRLKHDHVEFILDTTTLRYNDPRRFGCILYSKTPYEHDLFTQLGPEPLTDDFNAKYLLDKIKTRKTSIKQLIMDNHIVVGVGNIYACESLFLAKILPTRTGITITFAEIEQLTICIKQVLHLAIKQGGSTLRDYKQADGNLGYFQNTHNVYAKTNQPCKICNSQILEQRLGQRNSFYCPQCQK